MQQTKKIKNMIFLDESNSISISNEGDHLKLTLNLNIGFKKNYVIDLKLELNKIKKLIDILIMEKSEMEK